MPPSTQRRPRTRRVGSSPPEELPDSSPSRPRTKRRKVVETVETTSQLTPQDQVNAVIATLAMPLPEDQIVAVSKQWANEKNFQQNTHGVTAYAKVAGANWTYYVKDLIIRIGRPPDNRPSTAGSPTPPPPLLQKADDSVHIDLGPSKLVSRNHAVISYDTNGEHNWQIHVLGRNGVKVDDETYKKDSKTVLRSGSVIEIGGVQMMFVLPNKTPIVAPSILRRARLQHYVVDDEVPIALNPPNDSPFEPASAIARMATATAPTQSATAAAPVESRSRSNTLGTNNATGFGHHRGLLLEVNEDLDYSQDSMKEVKPPYSYALLIAQAILSSESEQLTLAAIYQFIMDKYSFYKHSNMGWQNSIRHNLSLNKAFRKIPRRTDEPGKGMKWELLPEHREEYIKKLRKPSKLGRQSSSQPGSPSSPRQKVLQPQSSRPAASFEDTPDLGTDYAPNKGSPQRSVTPPPMPSYRIQPLEAYTPDRGSRLPALRSADKTLSDTPRPPSRGHLHSGALSSHGFPNLGIGDAAPSPTAPSSYGDPDSTSNPTMSAVTPAPQRQHPRLAPPSTGQLPSSYLPTSSPAPFWKYVQFGSTPAKPNDFSPLKDLHSSSPPPIISKSSNNKQLRELGSPLKDRSGGLHLSGPRNLQPPPTTASALLMKDDEDEEGGMGDFPGIDLTRGFEKIGKFHVNGRFAESTSDWA